MKRCEFIGFSCWSTWMTTSLQQWAGEVCRISCGSCWKIYFVKQARLYTTKQASVTGKIAQPEVAEHCIQQDASNWQDTYWSCGLPPRLLPDDPWPCGTSKQSTTPWMVSGMKANYHLSTTLSSTSHTYPVTGPHHRIVLGCFCLPPPFAYCALHCMTRIAWLWNHYPSCIILPHCFYSNTMLCKRFHPFTPHHGIPSHGPISTCIRPHHFPPLHAYKSHPALH